MSCSLKRMTRGFCISGIWACRLLRCSKFVGSCVRISATNQLCVQKLQGSTDSPEFCRGSYEFAIDFRKNGAICRVDVGIDPYEAFTRNARNFEQFFKFRGKDPRKPGRFSWSVQGTPGEIEIPPARFLFPVFSFGEAKEKTEGQPQIFKKNSYIDMCTIDHQTPRIRIRLLPIAAACRSRSGASRQ